MFSLLLLLNQILFSFALEVAWVLLDFENFILNCDQELMSVVGVFVDSGWVVRSLVYVHELLPHVLVVRITFHRVDALLGLALEL